MGANQANRNICFLGSGSAKSGKNKMFKGQKKKKTTTVKWVR